MLTEHLWLRLRLPIMIPRSVESLDRRSATEKWIVGDISNFEYLLCVNAAAGRIAGPSANLHPILPWVRYLVCYFFFLTFSSTHLLLRFTTL